MKNLQKTINHTAISKLIGQFLLKYCSRKPGGCGGGCGFTKARSKAFVSVCFRCQDQPLCTALRTHWLRDYFKPLFFNFDQFDVKNNGLPGQGMIPIQGNRIVTHIRNDNRQIRSAGIAELQL